MLVGSKGLRVTVVDERGTPRNQTVVTLSLLGPDRMAVTQTLTRISNENGTVSFPYNATGFGLVKAEGDALCLEVSRLLYFHDEGFPPLPNLEEATNVVIGSTEAIELICGSGAGIEGVVIDESGRPFVANISLVSHRHLEIINGEQFDRTPRTQSNKMGQFSLESLAPGEATVRVDFEDQSQLFGIGPLIAGERITCSLAINRSKNLHGRAWDIQQGQWAKGIALITDKTVIDLPLGYRLVESGERNPDRGILEVQKLDQGRFSLSSSYRIGVYIVLLAEKCQVRVFGPFEPNTPVDLGQIFMEPERTIELYCEMAEFGPISGAHVSTTYVGPTGWQVGLGDTDIGGNLEISTRYYGRYLSAWKGDCFNWKVEIDSSKRNVSVNLEFPIPSHWAWVHVEESFILNNDVAIEILDGENVKARHVVDETPQLICWGQTALGDDLMVRMLVNATQSGASKRLIPEAVLYLP